MNKPNEGVATLLAFLLGLIGILGTGHMYARRLGRGLGFFILGIILLGTTGVFWALYLDSEEINWFTWESTYNTDYLFPIAIAGILYVIVWLWQIFDARKTCRQDVYGGMLP